MRNIDACLYVRPGDRVTLTPRQWRDAAENRRTRPHCSAVGSRLRDECHPARGSGVQADGLALAASLRGWWRRARAQGQRQGRARLQRHRAKEFIRFLKTIDRAVAKHLDVHAICDNYKTHKTREVQAWLAKHPRFKL